LYERGLMTEVGKVPPVFVRSEDGILALLQGGWCSRCIMVYTVW
jgi:hypothetical protein